MVYGLPIQKLPISPDDSIDMSRLLFPVETSKQNKSALLYIRNTGLKANFIFDQCSYNDKEEFLLLYLENNRLNIEIPILVTTWINILTYEKFNVELESILNEDEIKMFHENNKEFIDEIYKFLVSIPLCSMKLYDQFSGSNIDISEFKISKYNGFNGYTLIQLFDYKEIIVLSQSFSGIRPEYYEKYFNIDDEPYPDFVNRLVNKFPHLSLLNVLMNENPELIHSFISGIENMLNPEE